MDKWHKDKLCLFSLGRSCKSLQKGKLLSFMNSEDFKILLELRFRFFLFYDVI